MAFDLRLTRARAAALPPLVPIVELRRSRRPRVRWGRVLALAAAAAGSTVLWLLIFAVARFLLS